MDSGSGSGSRTNPAMSTGTGYGYGSGGGAGAVHRGVHEELLRESTVDPSVLIGDIPCAFNTPC